MTIQEMTEWFDIIQDKFDSPYFTDEEKELFLNRSQKDFINSYVKSMQGVSVIEYPHQFTEMFQTLIEADIPVAVDVDGAIPLSSIEGQLSNNTGVLHVMNVASASSGNINTAPNTYVKWVRHNDFYKFTRNVFKNPTLEAPVYTQSYKGINIKPSVFSEPFKVTVLRNPQDMSIANDISSEILDIYDSHNRIVSIALDYAGVTSRDQALLQLKQVTNG